MGTLDRTNAAGSSESTGFFGVGRARVRRGWVGRGWVGLVLAAAAWGCTPYHSSDVGSERGARLGRGTESDFPWAGETLSWHKLDLIEAWLGTDAAIKQPAVADRARLELAEGRLAMARSDIGRLGRADLEQRVEAARQDFRRVRTSATASRRDRLRADEGLEDARRVLGSARNSAPVTAKTALPAPVTGPANASAPRSRTILPRSSWGARNGVMGRLDREAGWRRITIHHSARPTSELGRADLPTVADALRRIQKFHIEDNGWGDIGYHYLIDPKGNVFEGRKATYQGAHAGSSQANRNNVGICLLGHFDTERPTPAALASLQGLCDAIRRRQSIPRSQVFSHKDFKETECPGRFLQAWLEHYRGELAAAR
ncbi:MAG: peptidoglycan recognition family protein [Planctomycetota bacterium]